MELVNVCLSSFSNQDFFIINTHIFSTIVGIVENITSAPVVQQVVPNIGENNKVNFTVTTFSVVEVGTVFASVLILHLLWFIFLSQLADS